MTTTSSNSVGSIPIQNTETRIADFLLEHGEIEAILPVVVGIIVTSRFQLKGAQALLANLIIASLFRQILTHLKKQSHLVTPETENISDSAENYTENNFDPDYTIVHSIPGRIRLRISRLATDADFSQRLEQILSEEEQIINIRINRAAASITINYTTQGTSDWELGMRLMNLIEAALNPETPANSAETTASGGNSR
ncbi:HMA2 domain-containing protein [Capilliphycus salinus ALCB114379]|uniref:HMA2 domain-containing protein n=1 Tax=Capilliphycus salinus TaxID=2768948 RepID=UPI0039A77EAD